MKTTLSDHQKPQRYLVSAKGNDSKLTIKTEAFLRMKHPSFTNEGTKLHVMREYNEEGIQAKYPLEYGEQVA